MTLTLYTLCGQDPRRHFSPHVWKVAMSLAHKGLAFEEAPTAFTAIPEIEGGVTKTVPLLRDGSRLVADSFMIAAYLEETYPGRPSLFGGEGGEGMARFVESWAQTVLRDALVPVILLDILGCLAPEDQAYFRQSREKRYGKPLEAVAADADRALAALPAVLEPVRATLSHQPFLGGARPLYSDYIVFGSLQWARVTSPARILSAGDPVAAWFERCLDLHGGLGRSVPSAADHHARN